MAMKYAKRRKALKKLKDPGTILARKRNKASTLAKVGIGSALIAPKAILLGAGYLAGRNKDKKEPKKYMAG